MSSIHIIKGNFKEKMELPIAEGLKAGFPSPAEDYNHETLDFNRDLIRNPEATFYGKVEGDSMIEAGINDVDIAVIDRINKVNGTETIVLGSQQYTQKDGKRKANVFAMLSSMITRVRTQQPVGATLLCLNNKQSMIQNYKIVTLCGSTRFKEQFMEAQKRLTLKGCIVISVGLFGHSGDDEVWQPGTKEMLDDMHLRKIDLADEIFVINVGGYIGESTRREITYAEKTGKKVNYLEKTPHQLQSNK